MVNLAWLSTVTHLITLTALREEFRSNQFHRILRVIAMGVLALMLICVMVPIGYLETPLKLPIALPAWCLHHPSTEWHDSSDNHVMRKPYNWVYIALAIGILVFTYCTRVAMLFSKNVAHALLRIPSGQPWKFIDKKLENLAMNGCSKRRYQFLRSVSMLLLTGI